jgi:hypothetical protein
MDRDSVKSGTPGRRRTDRHLGSRPASLRQAVLVADQHCRGINRASPISDIDHIHPYAHGAGPSFANIQGLSKARHTTRDHPAMHVIADPTSPKTGCSPRSIIDHHRRHPPPEQHPYSAQTTASRTRAPSP